MLPDVKLLKFTLRLVPDGWAQLKISNYRCHFRAFQLKVDNAGTKNFEIGPVVKTLQPFEISQNHEKSNFFETSTYFL